MRPCLLSHPGAKLAQSAPFHLSSVGFKLSDTLLPWVGRREGGREGGRQGRREGGVSLTHEPSSGRKRTEDEWKEKFRGGGVMKLRFMSSLKGEFTQNFFSPTMLMDSLFFFFTESSNTADASVCSNVTLVRRHPSVRKTWQSDASQN